MSRRITTLLVVLGALVAALIVVVAYQQSSQEIYDQAYVDVRLGWRHQAQFAGMYVAEEKGFYEDVGLTVTLKQLEDDVRQSEELAQGGVDVSVMEAHQVLEAVDSNVPLKAVAAIYQVNPHTLAARADSGISRPEDLAGKVIGFSGGEEEGSALFKIFVEEFGLAESVSYVSLGFDTVEDFRQNRADVIDVYRIDQPYLAEKEGLPLTVIPLDAYGFATYGDVLAFNQTFIEQEPETVERFVQATMKGWEYALAHQEETVNIVLRYTEGDYADPAYQRYILQQSSPLVRGTSTGSGLGRMNVVSWSTLYEAMRSAGALTTAFDVRDVFTNAYLE